MSLLKDATCTTITTKRRSCKECARLKKKCTQKASDADCDRCIRLSKSCAIDEVKKDTTVKRKSARHIRELKLRVELLEDQLARATVKKTKNILNCDPIIDIRLPDVLPPSTQYMFPKIILPSYTYNPMADNIMDIQIHESLPPRHILDELDKIYFDKIHPSFPMLDHSSTISEEMDKPHIKALRYAMWTITASITPKFFLLQNQFYNRARKYLELTELGFMTGVILTQAWALIAVFEFRQMSFPRAWTSVGNAIRTAQAMGMHQLDGGGSWDLIGNLPRCDTVTEMNVKRRTFWVVFNLDRMASIGTGWPVMINDADCFTSLPSEGDVALKIKEVCENPEKISGLSAYAVGAFMTAMFGSNLRQHARLKGCPADVFWAEHALLDSTLTKLLLYLPESLRMTKGNNDPNVVYMNLNVQTGIICLHQTAAMWWARKKGVNKKLRKEKLLEHDTRVEYAAYAIVNIMKLVSGMDMGAMNPFLSFCVYFSARVFANNIRNGNKDVGIHHSLEILMSVMKSVSTNNKMSLVLLAELERFKNSSPLPMNVHLSQIGGSTKFPFQQGMAVEVVEDIEEEDSNDNTFKSYCEGFPLVDDAYRLPDSILFNGDDW